MLIHAMLTTDLSIILMHTATTETSQTTLMMTPQILNQVTVPTTPRTLFTTVANLPGSSRTTHLTHHTSMNPSPPTAAVVTLIATILHPIIFILTARIPMVHLLVMSTSTALKLLL